MTASRLDILTPEVAGFLRRYAVRRGRLEMARGLAMVVALSLGWMLFFCVVDRFIALPWWIRLGLLGLHGAGVVLLLWAPLRGLLRRRVDWSAAAADVERRRPELNERLVTVTSQALSPRWHRASGDMLDRLVAEVDHALSPHTVREVLPMRALVGWALSAVVLLGGWYGLLKVDWLDLPRLAERYMQPLGAAPPVTTTRLAMVLDPAGPVVEGEPLTVRVEARRLGEDRVWLHGSVDGRSWRVWGMQRRLPESGGPWPDAQPGAAVPREGEGHFVYRFDAVDGEMVLFASGGDGRTVPRAVRVVRRPVISEFRIEYTYPAHTRREPLEVSNRSGLIDAPAGSVARVRIVASEPLSECEVIIGSGEVPGAEAAEADSTVAEPATRLEAEPSGDGRVWRVRMPLERDGSWRVRMRSLDGVEVSSGEMPIRVAPDHPPLVHLIQPADDHRAHPRDILAVQYQAMDDYGVADLWLRYRVNGAEEGERSLVGQEPGARRPRLEGTYELDLATLGLEVGDVLSLWLDARDSAGQGVQTEAVEILTAPRSIDINRYRLISQLREASLLAEVAVAELESVERLGREGDVDNGGGEGADQTRDERLSFAVRQLSEASEATALVIQRLLRAQVRSRDADLSVALASLVDEAQVQWWALEESMGLLWSHGLVEEWPFGSDGALMSRAGRLAEQVRRLAQGEQAGAILAELAALEELERIARSRQSEGGSGQREARSREAEGGGRAALVRGAERGREEVEAVLAGMEIDPAWPQERVQAALDDAVARGSEVIGGHSMVNYGLAAAGWGERVISGERDEPFLSRLMVGGQAEAYRRDADLVRARDLELSRRAAVGIERMLGEGLPSRDRQGSGTAGRMGSGGEGEVEAYVEALAALHGEHVLRAARHEPEPDDREVEGIVAAAREARALMAEWARWREGNRGLSSPAGMLEGVGAGGQWSLDLAEAQYLAMSASAEALVREYERAAALDEQLIRILERAERAGAVFREPVGRLAEVLRMQVEQARRLDEAQQEQEALHEDTAGAALPLGEAVAEALSGRQLWVVEKIESVGVPGAGTGSREAALERIQGAQQRLAGLPEQLAEVQRLWVARGAALDRVVWARGALDEAGPAARWAAEHMVREAERQLEEVERRLDAAASQVHPEVTDGLAAGLAGYSPETDDAVLALEEDLSSWLWLLGQVLHLGEPADVDLAAGEARRAIERSQAELRRAQDAIVEQDPLVAARWFALEAASMLAQRPPELDIAERQQRQTVRALSRAWEGTVRESAAVRLAATPQGGVVYAGAEGGESGASSGPIGRAGAEAEETISDMALPGLRQWGRIEVWEAESRPAARRELDPPGYHEAIRIYFDAIGGGLVPNGEPPQTAE